jgi:uncharacterized protein (TIGR01777 family)
LITEAQNSVNPTSVLITGGSGLVGNHLTKLLLKQGFKVSHLSRSGVPFSGVTVFKWDPAKKIIDPTALKGVNCIIHLAGANIGEKRWTEERKKEIVESRVNSAQFLYEKIKDNPNEIKAFISASAIGYYGSVTSEKVFTEEDRPASDFLGTVCSRWEETAKSFTRLGIRVVIIRTAVVLEINDSALSRLLRPAKLGMIVRTGTGKQYFPWIHFADLCNIYHKAITDNALAGAYNAVAPEHKTNDSFMRTLAMVMKRPVFLPPVPSFLLKLALGEMSDIALKGSRVSGEKIILAGYTFLYPTLEKALYDIICNSKQATATSL